MKIMAFDVSSSTVGWALFNIDKNNNIKLEHSGYFKPTKKGHIFDKLKGVRETVLDLLEEHEPDKVAIEDIAQFMPKVSSANTIITLALYNRTVGLTAFDFLNEPPELYSVMAIRHGLKLTPELPKKEEMPALVERHLGISLPVQYKKSGAVKSELYDEADAIACGLYCAFKLTNRLDTIKNSRKKS